MLSLAELSAINVCWHHAACCHLQDEQFGPFSGRQLSRFNASGVWHQNFLICHAAAAVWLPVWLVLELVGLPAASTAAPAAAAAAAKQAAVAPAAAPAAVAAPESRRKQGKQSAITDAAAAGGADMSDDEYAAPKKPGRKKGKKPAAPPPAAAGVNSISTAAAGHGNSSTICEQLDDEAMSEDEQDAAAAANAAAAPARKPRRKKKKKKPPPLPADAAAGAGAAAAAAGVDCHTTEAAGDGSASEAEDQLGDAEMSDYEQGAAALLAQVALLRQDSEYIEELSRAVDMEIDDDWQQQQQQQDGDLSELPATQLSALSTHAVDGSGGFGSGNAGTAAQQQQQQLVLVLDTNVLIDGRGLMLLKQLHGLQESSAGWLQLLVLLPWTVLVELDRLKSRERARDEPLSLLWLSQVCCCCCCCWWWWWWCVVCTWCCQLLLVLLPVLLLWTVLVFYQWWSLTASSHMTEREISHTSAQHIVRAPTDGVLHAAVVVGGVGVHGANLLLLLLLFELCLLAYVPAPHSVLQAREARMGCWFPQQFCKPCMACSSYVLCCHH
jgi:hypothetical protein